MPAEFSTKDGRQAESMETGRVLQSLRHVGSGRPWSIQTEDSVTLVKNPILGREDKPQNPRTRRTVQETAVYFDILLYS